jgi:hypothetical protein
MDNPNFKKFYSELKNKADYARAIGFHPVYLSMVAGGHRAVSLPLARAIEAHERGRVKASHLLELDSKRAA